MASAYGDAAVEDHLIPPDDGLTDYNGSHYSPPHSK